jgi:hypothetical protein
MRLLITNLKHFFFTFTLLLSALISVGVYFGADANIGDNPLAYKVGEEGPHIFYEKDQLVVNHIRGGRDEGFYLDQKHYSLDSSFKTKVYFPLENSDFEVQINPEIITPAVWYDDDQPIIALSDVEAGFKTFRDFLITNKVIDADLNWMFGKGHLVLVGDFVDRGASQTQVLWFIYKLEQSAVEQGGKVHFILGNHEIKNLQGNFQKMDDKYYHVASMLGKSQDELYDENSFMGRWLTSKNTMEVINGYLFVHGGIHPDITKLTLSLEEINQVVRDNYTQSYFTKPNTSDVEMLLSTTKGPSWYRGYFEADLTQQQVEQGLQYFDVKAVVVGHQPQWSINQIFEGKVIAINVKHPNDYRSNFPPRSSEGVLIENGKRYRVLDDGSKEELF